MCKCSGFSASSPTLVTSFMNNSYTDECGISLCFESHFPNDYWWWASFLVLIGHLDIYISSEKCLFKFFVLKKNVWFVFVVELQKFYIYSGFSHYFFSFPSSLLQVLKLHRFQSLFVRPLRHYSFFQPMICFRYFLLLSLQVHWSFLLKSLIYS